MFVMQMDTEASLREYLKVQLRVPVFGRLGPVARAFDFVATAAPGVREILTVGKICWDLRESIRVVPTGTSSSSTPPRPVTSSVSSTRPGDPGARRRRPDPQPDRLDGRAAARPGPHRAQRGHVPEEMPVNETIELVAAAREHLDVPLGVVVVNRVLPEPFTRGDEEVFEALHEPAALAALRDGAGGGIDQVLDAARLAVSMRRSRAPHLAHLREEVDLPMLLLPYLFVRDHGLRVTRMVADALGQELL